MAVLTIEQEDLLVAMVKEKSKENPEFANKAEELVHALKKDSADEGLELDIESCAEGINVTLTPEEQQKVIAVMRDYDYSDYNDFITDTIREITGRGDEEDEDF